MSSGGARRNSGPKLYETNGGKEAISLLRKLCGWRYVYCRDSMAYGYEPPVGDKEAAEILNQRGFSQRNGKRFSYRSVENYRKTHGIERDWGLVPGSFPDPSMDSRLGRNLYREELVEWLTEQFSAGRLTDEIYRDVTKLEVSDPAFRVPTGKWTWTRLLRLREWICC